MGIFGFGKKEKSEPKVATIYIVEDSAVYAKQLEFGLQKRFGEAITVSCFPVAEVMEVKLEHGKIPDMIIMDHFLNDRYYDAEHGFDALKRIKESYPSIELVLHSSQEPGEHEAGLFRYVPKGEHALPLLEDLIEKRVGH